MNQFLSVLAHVDSSIAIVIAIIIVIALLPRWNYSREWGYRPSGIATILLVMVLVLLLVGCETTKVPTIGANGSVATNVEVDLQNAVARASADYLKVKGGSTDYLWSMSEGVWAYQTLVKGEADIKAVVASYSDGKKAGMTFAQNIAHLFAASQAAPSLKAAVIASVIQKQAAEADSDRSP